MATKYVPALKIDAFIQLFVSDPKMDDSDGPVTDDVKMRSPICYLFVKRRTVRELVVIVSEANWTFPGF